jgi:hypothetical protein
LDGHWIDWTVFWWIIETGVSSMTTGEGLFVAWYDTDPAFQPELDRWHSKEHMPERVRLPGFLTGQRYRGLDEQRHYCVLYRTDDVRTFVSEPYLQVLNNPTEWTRRMMPGFRNLNRSLCSVVREAGSGFGNILHTIQFSPAPTRESGVLNWIDDVAIPTVLAEPGAVRLALAISNKAITRTKTNEQALRAQPDAISDWILLIESYTEPSTNQAWRSLTESIEEHGGHSPVGRTFQLSHLLVSP